MRAIGILLVVAALVIAVVPQRTHCGVHGGALLLASGATAPMRCTWTARAELAVALPLLGVALAMIFARRRETERMLSLLGATSGVAALLVPTALIGVCNGPMTCSLFMRPVLVMAGLVTVVLGLFGLVLAARTQPGVATEPDV